MSIAAEPVEQSSANAQGLLLKDAVLAFADQALVHQLQLAEAALRSIPPRPSFIQGPAGAWRRWHATYDGVIPRRSAAVTAARKAVLASLAARLQDGELEGFGIRLVPPSDLRPEPIARELWDILELHPGKSQAMSTDLKYGGVRIRLRIDDAARHLPPEAVTAAAIRDESSLLQAPAPKLSRVAVSTKIRAIMRRLAENRSFSGNRSADAKLIHRAAAEDLRGAKLPSVESIRRGYREFYLALLKKHNLG